MKAKVTQQGVVIPRDWFPGVEEVEIRRRNGMIVVVPVYKEDPIWGLGKNPVPGDVTDASTNLDKYLYGNE